MLRRSSLIVIVGALFALLVPNANAGGGCHGSPSMTTGRADGEVTVPIEGCAYSPAILYVEPGTEVSWVNRDPAPHTVTGIGLSIAGDHHFSQGQRTESFRFDDAGVYPYYCILHAGMAGAVLVGDVGADKASAEKLQGIPLAVSDTNDARPQPRGGEGSNNLVPMLIVGVGTVVAAALLIAEIKRRRRGPQPVSP